jgi:hypothetical protein
MLTPPEPFAHDGHLSPDDPCLGSRHQPLALVKRKPERLLRREIIALNAGQLSLGRDPRLELGEASPATPASPRSISLMTPYHTG